eukprot:8175364-Karenia_brevis.AAC.1
MAIAHAALLDDDWGYHCCPVATICPITQGPLSRPYAVPFPTEAVHRRGLVLAVARSSLGAP